MANGSFFYNTHACKFKHLRNEFEQWQHVAKLPYEISCCQHGVRKSLVVYTEGQASFQPLFANILGAVLTDYSY